MSASRFKDSPLGLVPKDWTVEAVGECFDLLRNNTFSRAMLDEQPGEVYDVHYGDVLVKYDTIIDCRRDRLPSLRKEVSVGKSVDYAQEGDLIFADTAEDDTVGKAVELVNVDDLKIVSGLHTIFMRPKMHRFASKWLGYFVNSNAFHSQLLPFVAGSKVSSISRGNIKRAYVLIPTEKEQRRIAEILSTCDEVITRSRAVVEKLRKIKAGMLNDFFTRGIGTDGQLRPTPQQAPKLYKDSTLGPIPKEWEVKQIGDPEVSEVNPGSSELPESFVYIDLESVKNGVLQNENLVDRAKAPSRAQRLVNGDDILYQLVRPYQRNNYLFRPSANNHYVASTGYALLRPKGSSEYLFQYVHTDEFVNKVLALCTGTGYPAITPRNLARINIRVPLEPEQGRIAERLAAMDERIVAEERVIAKYRSVKAGLMQRLLAPPDGVEIVDETNREAV